MHLGVLTVTVGQCGEVVQPGRMSLVMVLVKVALFVNFLLLAID